MSGSNNVAAPIFSLYRTILRIHRMKLPTPVREMGDRYVREEFISHLHGKTTQTQWKSFVQEWQRYADMLTGSADLKNSGTLINDDDSIAVVTGIDDRSGEISEDVIGQMSADQIDRLQKMRKEAVKFGREIYGVNSSSSSFDSDQK